MVTTESEVNAVVGRAFEKARAEGAEYGTVPPKVLRLWRGVSRDFEGAFRALSLRCASAGNARGPVASRRAYLRLEAAESRYNSALRNVMLVAAAVADNFDETREPALHQRWADASDLTNWEADDAAVQDVDGRTSYVPPMDGTLQLVRAAHPAPHIPTR